MGPRSRTRRPTMRRVVVHIERLTLNGFPSAHREGDPRGPAHRAGAAARRTRRVERLASIGSTPALRAGPVRAKPGAPPRGIGATAHARSPGIETVNGVTRAPATHAPAAGVHGRAFFLHRKCACGSTSSYGGECESCRGKRASGRSRSWSSARRTTLTSGKRIVRRMRSCATRRSGRPALAGPVQRMPRDPPPPGRRPRR
jgi:hypothetical protein